MKKYLTVLAVISFLLLLKTPVLAAEDYPHFDARTSFTVQDEDGNETIFMGDEQSVGTYSVDHWSNSKKGIQENEYMTDPDYQSLGVKHVLLNLVLNFCVSYQNGQYILTEDAQISQYRTLVSQLNSQGITVTMVLLLRWDDRSSMQQLIYPGARQPGHSYYALNAEDNVGRSAWLSIFNRLMQIFGPSGSYVKNWVLSNEVNQYGPTAYNYTGSSDLNTNASAYANAFILLDQAIARYNPSAGAYISMDHNWTATDTGHAGKNFLDAFIGFMNSRSPGAGWNVAWHPYAPSLRSSSEIAYQDKVIWNSPGITHSLNTRYVCGSNIEVLTNYIKNNWGSSHRVILSEQGYDATGGEDLQSAFIAYTYYAAQYNDMIDAVMFRAYIDNPAEEGLKLGLLSGSINELYGSGNRSGYIQSHKRQAYDVFKYMDTDYAYNYTSSCLNTIGAPSWNSLISSYTGPSSNDVIFEDVNTNDWYWEDVKYSYQNGLMLGMDADTFGGGVMVSRAQFAVIIYRMMGSPSVSYNSAFSDIASGQWYTNAVLWCYNNGIVKGYGDSGIYGPANPITREDVAVILRRYAQYRQADVSKSASLAYFADVEDAHAYASEALSWAVAEGIITGKENGRILAPISYTTRAECAALITRVDKLLN